ncbi:MAG: transglycosylase domain-containing protein [Hymenobacter sp.]
MSHAAGEKRVSEPPENRGPQGTRKCPDCLAASKTRASLSKQRMFEVYLNIIEWGPSKYRWPSGKRGVYGVKEAALFYYGKRPNELNLPESLYLASIIPKPKYYR